MRLAGALLLAALLLSLLCAASCSAGDITFATDRSDYYFTVGESARIPVAVTTTLGEDVLGTLTGVAAVTTPGGTEVRRSSTTRSFTVFADMDAFAYPAGEAEVPQETDLTLTFTYENEGGVCTASLEGIRIHILAEGEAEGDPGEPLVSMPTEGSLAPPGSTSPRTSASSGTAPSSSTVEELLSFAAEETPSSSAVLPEDMGVRLDRMEEAAVVRDAMETALRDIITADPLYGRGETMLADAGYAAGRLSVAATSPQNGTFGRTDSLGTQKVLMNGTVTGGSVSLIELSSSGPLPRLPSLTANATYRSAEQVIAASGYSRVSSVLQLTAAGMETREEFTSGGGMEALLWARLSPDGTVTGVVFEETAAGDDLLLPLLLTVMVIGMAVVIGWRVGRRPEEVPSPGHGAVVHPGGPTLPARLAAAEEAFVRGEYKTAYLAAAQCLRTTPPGGIAGGRPPPTGITDEEYLALVADPHRRERIAAILARCSRVGFAKGRPDAAEFGSICSEIRKIWGEEKE